MRFRFQVPSSAVQMVLTEMRSAGYDVTLVEADVHAEMRELRLWIFAGQSALQAELLLARLVPDVRLLSQR